MGLLKSKQIDIDGVADAVMTRILAVPNLLNKFWNLSNSVNTFVTTPSTSGPVQDIVISSITSNSAEVSWTAVPGATTYEIQYIVKGDIYSAEAIVAVSAPPFILTGLSSGTTYVVQIKPVF